MPLATTTRLGPYEILAPLSAGGMGEVYRARDTRLNRDVAIKVLAGNLPTDFEARRLLEHEAKATAALSHPNILVIHDFGTDHGAQFVVMELLDGETLRRRLARYSLPWRKAASIGAAVAEGLAAAHARGLLHLDLKPENIFLTSDERVKILDFGIARWTSAAGRHDQIPANPVSVVALGTHDDEIKPPDNPSTDPLVDSASLPTAVPWGEVDTVLGTPPYMSPEQVQGHPVGPASDIFSLGCVLYEMITGRRVFARQSRTETMEAIVNEYPPEIGDWGKRCPPVFDRLIVRCIEKEPELRYQSTRDLAFQLKSIADGYVSSGFSGLFRDSGAILFPNCWKWVRTLLRKADDPV